MKLADVVGNTLLNISKNHSTGATVISGIGIGLLAYKVCKKILDVALKTEKTKTTMVIPVTENGVANIENGSLFVMCEDDSINASLSTVDNSDIDDDQDIDDDDEYPGEYLESDKKSKKDRKRKKKEKKMKHADKDECATITLDDVKMASSNADLMSVINDNS